MICPFVCVVMTQDRNFRFEIFLLTFFKPSYNNQIAQWDTSQHAIGWDFHWITPSTFKAQYSSSPFFEVIWRPIWHKNLELFLNAYQYNCPIFFENKTIASIFYALTKNKIGDKNFQSSTWCQKRNVWT